MSTPDLSLPPLLWDEAANGPAFDHARLRATQGCDAGLIVHDLGANTLQVALVFAPEVPLADAVVMLPLCALGFQNALGALAPPEVAVHLTWNGAVHINGGSCGAFQIAASDPDPAAIPDWLVVGFTLPLWPENEDAGGATPNDTTLYAEGCVEVQAPALVEAFARHTLNWIGRWEDLGTKPLHDEWRGIVLGIGEDTQHNGIAGIFVGVDERFGMLVRHGDTTDLIPLTTLLETTP
ncbi:MAG: BirA family biotin operon repressor/biotin-[acetyl-CoA-carboxylase] ligase [Yoonia sp.]|jgi:BirA family biotin operon repressor/biotin-[acetyl-CoA-carboxylase] ligase